MCRPTLQAQRSAGSATSHKARQAKSLGLLFTAAAALGACICSFVWLRQNKLPSPTGELSVPGPVSSERSETSDGLLNAHQHRELDSLPGPNTSEWHQSSDERVPLPMARHRRRLAFYACEGNELYLGADGESCDDTCPSGTVCAEDATEGVSGTCISSFISNEGGTCTGSYVNNGNKAFDPRIRAWPSALCDRQNVADLSLIHI